MGAAAGGLCWGTIVTTHPLPSSWEGALCSILRCTQQGGERSQHWMNPRQHPLHHRRSSIDMHAVYKLYSL
jgi:hypothetical protein